MQETSLPVLTDTPADVDCPDCPRYFTSNKALNTHRRYCEGRTPALAEKKTKTGALSPRKGVNASPQKRERKLDVPFSRRVQDRSGNCQVYLELLHDHALGKIELDKGQLDSIKELLNRALGKSVTPAVIDAQSGEAVRLLAGLSDDVLEAALADGADDPPL